MFWSSPSRLTAEATTTGSSSCWLMCYHSLSLYGSGLLISSCWARSWGFIIIIGAINFAVLCFALSPLFLLATREEGFCVVSLPSTCLVTSIWPLFLFLRYPRYPPCEFSPQAVWPGLCVLAHSAGELSIIFVLESKVCSKA